ncbi:MAG: DUF4910 domain-containing protein [Hyphomicrobiaceae bacterium]
MRARPHQISKLFKPGIGADIHELASELYPICRSITGHGVRETLEIIGRHIELDVHEIASGTAVLDWVVPREWNVREAHITGPDGRRIVDFADSNLHVVGYSTPVRMQLSLDALRPHIFTLPDQPSVIPYRTSYYSDAWGFCMAHDDFTRLPEGGYDVLIDSTLTDGSLTYGEFYIPGKSEDEVLLSAHICHPSMANDNCSALALLTLLASRLSTATPRLSYRFVFAPGTIGAIAWLHKNEDNLQRIKHGLVLSCLGDAGGPTYKRSRRGNAKIDQAMAKMLTHAAPSASIQDFSPYGYDERQYCSPGFDLPVGSFQRSQWGSFPEYHTSSDNLSFIKPEHLGTSFHMITEALDILENDSVLINKYPKGEPQLGRRGLYAAVGGNSDAQQSTLAMLWVLNLSDGAHSLLDIAVRSGLAFDDIRSAATLLEDHGLLVTAVPTNAA